MKSNSLKCWAFTLMVFGALNAEAQWTRSDPYCLKTQTYGHEGEKSWRDDLDAVLEYNSRQFTEALKDENLCRSNDLKSIQDHFWKYPSSHTVIVADWHTGVAHVLDGNGVLIESVELKISKDQQPPAQLYPNLKKVKGRWMASSLQNNEQFSFELLKRKNLDLNGAQVVVSVPGSWGWKSEKGKLMRRPMTACYQGNGLPIPIHITIEDSDVRSNVSERFVKTLEAFKPKLMSVFRVSNEDYDRLAKLAFALTGKESEFGAWGAWYYNFAKENPLTDWIIEPLREHKWKKGLRSRGLIQMKAVPKEVLEVFPELSDRDLLVRPDYSAVAIMGYLSLSLKELRNRRAEFNRLAPKKYQMTDENELDYLPYLYMGRNSAIKKGTATPDQNKYVKEMKEWLPKVKVQRADSN